MELFAIEPSAETGAIYKSLLKRENFLKKIKNIFKITLNPLSIGYLFCDKVSAIMTIEPFIVDNYIVRIYRRDEEDLRKIAGIVEQVGTEERRSFHSLDELWICLRQVKVSAVTI